MHLRRLLGLLCPAGAVVFLAGLALGQGVPSAGDMRETGHTLPSSERVEHRLKIADVVESVPVKLGERVKAGQVLLKEDTREEDAELAMYKVVADSNVDIDIARKKQEGAQKEFDRQEKMFNDKQFQSTSVAEYEKAKVDLEVAKLEVEKAKLDKKTAELKVKRLQATIDAKQIVSKIDGIVEKIDIKPGEVVDPTKPAVTVVKNDPLWVMFRPFSAVSLQLKVGQELDVYYEGEQQPHKAKVFFISPEVDAASDRQEVRLEMPNPQDKPSGLRVKIALPKAAVAVETKKD